MVNLQSSKNIKSKCNSVIIISGVARSGTTIIGKVIHSMKNVEYIFEPELLFPLFSLIKKLPAQDWQSLYETYLYKDFLINALAGRNLNLNKKDDSSIYHVKNKDLILQRQSRSWRKREVEKILHNSQIVYKMPDIVPIVPKMQKYYPKTKVILMHRNFKDVSSSLKKKGWFTDKGLKNPPNCLYNEYAIHNLNEDQRIKCYYDKMYREVKKIKNLVIINYEDLIKNPNKEIKKICQKFNLKYGPKTKDVISTIKLRKKT